jgi:hypothetical protein
MNNTVKNLSSAYLHYLRAEEHLRAEERLNIAPAMHHAKNQCVLVLQTVNDDVLPNRKAPQAGAKVNIAGSGPVADEQLGGRICQ